VRSSPTHGATDNVAYDGLRAHRCMSTAACTCRGRCPDQPSGMLMSMRPDSSVASAMEHRRQRDGTSFNRAVCSRAC
jgi:hypothetical protein